MSAIPSSPIKSPTSPMKTHQPLSPTKSNAPLPHFFQVLNLENDENARALVNVFTEQIALAEEIVKCREELTEAEEALGKVEQARKEFAQERKRDEKKLDEKTRQALKKEKKNAERAARKRGFPISGGLTVTSTNVLTFVEAQASLASVSGPKDICRVVDVIKNEGTLVSDTGRHFHTGPIRNETTFQLLCGLAFREVAEARDKVTALEKRAKELDQLADKGHQGLMEAVRKRYKVLAVRMHPDKLTRPPTEEDYQRFRELQTAHQVLSDTELRRRYIQMMDHNAFLATLPKPSKDADQEGHRPVIKRDNGVPQPSRTAHPNEHRRLTGGFPHQCTMPRVMDTILTDPKRGHSRIMLSWSCASAEELQISRYELHVKQRTTGPETSEWVRIYLGWSTEWWTDVLPPGHYSFRVRAENNLGLGEWSTFLDYYVEDIQAARQQRREELERNKEERRGKIAKRLRNQISMVLNQTGNIPTTEKLSKLRTLLEQARRSKMDEVVQETEDIVSELEARVAKNEEQHLWRSKLNEFVKAVLKEGGDGRVLRENQDGGDENGSVDPDDDLDMDDLEDGQSGASSPSKLSSKKSMDGLGGGFTRRPPLSPRTSDTEETLSDMEDFLLSLPSMYPPDTPYILPPTIRNQIVQTVQALIRNRPPLQVVSIVPETNDPNDVSLSVSNTDVYRRILAINEAALQHKEYLGSQAGFREIEISLKILTREIDDANRAMEKKRQQIEAFLKDRERSMRARLEADRAARERAQCYAPAQPDPVHTTITEAVDDIPQGVIAVEGDEEGAVKPKDVRAHSAEHIEEPPPPYSPRECDDAGTQFDADGAEWNDPDQDRGFEIANNTPRLRRRGTRGGARRRKSDAQNTQLPTVSPRQVRRGNKPRAKGQGGVAAAAESLESQDADREHEDGKMPYSVTNTTTGPTHARRPSTVQFGDIQVQGQGDKDDVWTGDGRDSSFGKDDITSRVDATVDSKLFELLSSLNLEQHVPAFLAHDIKWADVPYLQEADLVQLGITKVGPRKRIMQVVDEAKSKPDRKSVAHEVTAVSEWLRNLQLEEYEDVFAREEVAFEDLQTLSEDDLVNTFKIDKIGHLRRAIAAIGELQKKGSAAPTTDSKNIAGMGTQQPIQSALRDRGSNGIYTYELNADPKLYDQNAGIGQPPLPHGRTPYGHAYPQGMFPHQLDYVTHLTQVDKGGVVTGPAPGLSSVPQYNAFDRVGSGFPTNAPIASDLQPNGHSVIDPLGINPATGWAQNTGTLSSNGNRTWQQPRSADLSGSFDLFGTPTAADTVYGTYPGAGGAATRSKTAFEAGGPNTQMSNGFPSHNTGVYRQQAVPPSSLTGRYGTTASDLPGMATSVRPGLSTVPADFICSLSRSIMNLPVRGPDGYYYDHSQLRARLIADNTWRSPVTMTYYPVETWHRHLNAPDMQLKTMIDAWVLNRSRRRSSVGALNAARDIWEGGSDAVRSGGNGFISGGNGGAPVASGVSASSAAHPATSSGLKATMGLSGWTADVPGGASIWR